MKYTGRCGQNGLNIVQGYAEPLAAHEREARVRPHRVAALPAGQREEQRVLGPGEQLDDPVQEAGALERAEGGGGEGSHVQVTGQKVRGGLGSLVAADATHTGVYVDLQL